MRILMVCLGNICRSPLAHGIMQKLVSDKNLSWTIHSAGTAAWHVGKSPDNRSIQAAKKLGYDISKQRAQQFTVEMFSEYDYIFVMDKNNYVDVTSLTNNSKLKAKVKLFLESEDLMDPYYDDNMFIPISIQVEKRCSELIQNIIRLQQPNR